MENISLVLWLICFFPSLALETYLLKLTKNTEYEKPHSITYFILGLVYIYVAYKLYK